MTFDKDTETYVYQLQIYQSNYFSDMFNVSRFCLRNANSKLRDKLVRVVSSWKATFNHNNNHCRYISTATQFKDKQKANDQYMFPICSSRGISQSPVLHIKQFKRSEKTYPICLRT